MKTTVLFVVFGLFLTWLEPAKCQRDVRIPPTIGSIFPEDFYMPLGPLYIFPYKCDQTSGIPKPEIYWQYYVNGVFKKRLYPNEEGTRTYSGTQLRLKTINSNEQYQCVAKNRFGVALSTKIRLHIAYGATFNRSLRSTPLSVTSAVGKSLSIPCKYQNLGIPQNFFSWKHGDEEESQNVKIGERIFTSETGSLVFSYLEASDGDKTYTCNIESKILTMFNYGGWTKLSVTGGPDIPDSSSKLLYHTKNNTVAIHKKGFTMQCLFGGKPVPKVQWEIPFASRRSTRFTEKANNELEISSVAEDDEGYYKCTSMQKLGSPVTVSFYIDVKGPPVWVKKPTSSIIAQGHNGVFHCDARSLKGEKSLGKPKWFKNGVPLQIAPGAVSGRTHLSIDGKVLTIHNALKSEDICNYQCSVANEEGEVYADAAFNVILNTEILLAPESQHIDKGDVAILNIKAQTDPLKEKALSYTWILNGRKIEFLDLFDIYLLPNNSLVVNTTGMDENRFEIILGNYSVNISNGVETVTSYASLMGNPSKKPIVSQSGMDLRWIALIVAVVLLFIIFILLLCVLFNRHGGDDYSVDKKERKAGHDPEKELADSGFHDLPRTDDDPDKQKPDNVSISSAAKSMGSETDSMEEYSDADAGSRFNEDGSFIGAYQGHESKGNVSHV